MVWINPSLSFLVCLFTWIYDSWHLQTALLQVCVSEACRSPGIFMASNNLWICEQTHCYVHNLLPNSWVLVWGLSIFYQNNAVYCISCYWLAWVWADTCFFRFSISCCQPHDLLSCPSDVRWADLNLTWTDVSSTKRNTQVFVCL